MNYRLTLYVSGSAPHSTRARENFERICSTYLKGLVEQTVIDVVLDPDAAEADKILATPTLVRHLPLPVRKIVGDLTDLERTLRALEIYSVLVPIDPEEAP